MRSALRAVRLTLVPLALAATLAAPAGAQELRSRIFLGTWGQADSRLGHVYRYEDGTDWTRLDPGFGLADAVWDLAWHDGELWATTHDGPPASFPDAFGSDTRPHGDVGRVWRYDGLGWTEASPPGGFGSAATTVSSMDGRLYVTVDQDGLYRWEGGRSWSLLGDFRLSGQAIVSSSHAGTPMLYVGQDNTDEFWVHDPTGALPCGDFLGDPSSSLTNCQVPAPAPPGEPGVCSADCWPGSCIHAFAEFDAGAGPLVHAGAYVRRMYRWEPTTRLFVRIDDVPAGPSLREQHVQGMGSFRNLLWVGLSDGALWSTVDATSATYTLDRQFDQDWPISEIMVDEPDDLLWVGFGAVPYRWARHDGVAAGVETYDGTEWVRRADVGAFPDGVLVLLPVEPEIACDAGPDQVVECEGPETAVQLDGSATEIPAALGLPDPTFEWTGGFREGTADGPSPVVHFEGKGDFPVTLTVTAGTASATCETLVSVVDTTPPIPLAVLEPAAPLPPISARSPLGPLSARSACSAPTSALFAVRCSATDICDPAPDVAASLRVRWHELGPDGACDERFESLAVACDELVQVLLVAPPCTARPPRSAAPASGVGSDGRRFVRGESVELVVTATDACDNAATATADAAAMPEDCDDPLADGSCCPAVAAPEAGCDTPCP